VENPVEDHRGVTTSQKPKNQENIGTDVDFSEIGTAFSSKMCLICDVIHRRKNISVT
jgi:hypothetical protein